MRKHIINLRESEATIAKAEPFDSLIYYAKNAGDKKIVKKLKELNKIVRGK